MNLRKLPKNSGVYLFKNNKGLPIYIGKANNIQSRVKSHFSSQQTGLLQKKLLIETVDIETLKVDSEIEALILEANLIKKYKPQFNRQLKDDKDYLYIKITRELFPRVLSCRKKTLFDAKYYFGPYPSASKLRTTLKLLRKLFPYSTCRVNQKKPCLHYHIGLCPGVCTGIVRKSEYDKTISKIKYFLDGKINNLLSRLESEKKHAVRKLDFETARSIQDQINSIKYITRPNRFLNEEETLYNTKKTELLDLKEVLNLPKIPRRIECYDISNLQGTNPVGSMVVFLNGEADKSSYRKFKIKYVKGINDVAMLKEVLSRRIKNDWEKPDLIVVDGGKPQLNVASKVLSEFDYNVALISLAKKLEEIYLPTRNKSLLLPRSKPSLKLIQRIRDEAHRFAITYHKKVRKVNFLSPT